MEKDKYLSVTALTRYLKYKFDSDEHLKAVFLRGEISNFKKHSTGHMYFSVKDEGSKINAIMFNAAARKLNFEPQDGSKVLMIGRVSVYEATGNYQIYVDDMQEDGKGNLYIEFEKLKAKLSEEGLFNPEFKKPIPKVPKRIGIITAPTGAAIKDIISTIDRRFPICETILFPSLVQGENAASDIVRNIRMAEDYNLDVLIVGRGGGSIEDLWPFNEEIVARAIFECSIPVISAVGHEVDFTIADFVADLRAPTPTGAAEMAVPNIADIIKHIDQYRIRINNSIIEKVNYRKFYLEKIKNSFVIKNPMIMYDNKKQKLDIINERINNNVLSRIEKTNFYFKTLIEKLEIVNPLNVLKRGFSITYKDDVALNSIKNVKNGDNISITLTDGKINATVNDIMEVKNG